MWIGLMIVSAIAWIVLETIDSDFWSFADKKEN